MEKMNRNKAEQLWVDSTLFILYGQENVKYSLRTKLFIVKKLAFQNMVHDLEDHGRTRSGFEICLASMRINVQENIQNRL
jgi:hypothetical protein